MPNPLLGTWLLETTSTNGQGAEAELLSLLANPCAVVFGEEPFEFRPAASAASRVWAQRRKRQPVRLLPRRQPTRETR